MASDFNDLFDTLGIRDQLRDDGDLPVFSPIDGARIAVVSNSSADAMREAIGCAQSAFTQWRTVPAPRRGELVRLFADELRANKQALGRLVTLEAGKVIAALPT